MKFAAIDVGSNAVRLLLARVDNAGPEPIYEKISNIRMPIRLGEDAFVHGRISEEKADRFVKCMIGFKYLLQAYEPIDFMAFATSAMREAENSQMIVDRVKEESGIELNVISGRKEAETIYSNRIEKILDNHEGPYLHIDVGGGSTEVILFDKSKVMAYRSFNIGAIRILEGLTSKKDWAEMQKWVAKVTANNQPVSAIGSGGNITKIFRLSNAKVGKALKLKEMNKVHECLNSYTLEQRITKLGLRPDRADIIIPASNIYMSVMEWGNVDTIHVPQLGLGDGMIHVLYEKHKKNYV
ncbi:exopolyphosphatase [Methanolobus sp. ZRKC3]|uniref:Ppx/GppA phosphatase family protein n=1 Tax=Methanolobus sp. ZRKC3 TaxID=3125786 RepID=UPI00324693EE